MFEIIKVSVKNEFSINLHTTNKKYYIYNRNHAEKNDFTVNIIKNTKIEKHVIIFQIINIALQ